MSTLHIRGYQKGDKDQVIDLWHRCKLTVPWNNPEKDIQRKVSKDPDLFFVGTIGNTMVATCMAGYEGHRGSIYYLGVAPEYQRQGIANKMIRHAEERLKSLGCPKINLMVRDSNIKVQAFYHQAGYANDPVVVLSKRLIED